MNNSTQQPTTLTPNGIKLMYQMNSSMNNEFFLPTLQVLRLKKLNENGVKKWVVALSDGQNFLYGECDTCLHEMIHDHIIAQNAIIRLQHFDMSTRGDRKVCYIFDAQQAAPNPGMSLGSPKDMRLFDLPEPARNLRTTVVPPSDDFYAAQSKPRWQNGYRDAQVRRGIIDSIERVLVDVETRQKPSGISAKRKEELKTFSHKWELKLYEQAHSFEAYVDMSTFNERVKDISRNVHSRDEIFLHHHHRLHLWRHAMMCNETECSFSPFCSTIKDVCHHIEGCHDNNCEVPFCSTFKKLMHHSRSCRDVECQVCEPSLRVAGCVFCEEEERKSQGTAREVPTADVQTKLKQEYMLTMFHASTCPHEEDGKCLHSPLCFDLKKVWRHKIYCTNMNCQFPFCATSKVFTDHYHSCSVNTCQVCPPVRETRIKHGVNTFKVDVCQMCPPTQNGVEQNAQTEAGGKSSGPDVVQSQVKIYQEIQKRNKQRQTVLPATTTSSQNPAGNDASNSRDDNSSYESDEEMHVDEVTEQHANICDASQTSYRSAAELKQISEYEKLRRAHQQRLQERANSSPTSQGISEINLDTKPAAVPSSDKGSDKKSHSRGSKSSDEKKSQSHGSNGSSHTSECYMATTHATRNNTEHVVCTHCHKELFSPASVSQFYCQECNNVSAVAALA